MKRVVNAGIQYYNANSRNKYVGDCVKRALSLAFNEDYDAVSSELNRIKRDKGASAFNISPVFNEYLKRRGVAFSKFSPPITEEEFTQEYPSGTYLLLTGSDSLAAKGISNHMVAVIDGNIYDSWNSSDNLVVKWAKVTSSATDFFVVDTDYLVEQLLDYCDKFSKSLSKKMPYATFYVGSNHIDVRNHGTTLEIPYRVVFDDSIPPESSYYPHRTYGKDIIMKITPRKSTEENLDLILPKVKQRMYDFAYSIRREIDDVVKSKEISLNPDFRGDRSRLMYLPEWVRPLVTRFYENPSFEYDKYEVYMDTLPGDPRDPNGTGDVLVRGDTLRELKYNLEAYRKSYARYGYDY